MITTIRFVNMNHHTLLQFLCVCVMRTFKIHSLSNCQMHAIVLLTIVTMQNITSPGLIYLITGNLYLLTAFTYFILPLPPACGNHQSVLCIYECGVF